MHPLGYGTFWMAEHHFQPEGYECIPNIILLNPHLAHLRENIRLGSPFNITPMWHALRLADFATADLRPEADWSSLVVAVVDHLKLGRFIIVAATTGVGLAVDYSLLHPEHFIALLLGTWAVRWSTALFDRPPLMEAAKSSAVTLGRACASGTVRIAAYPIAHEEAET
jgi:pimeloyl-ACP methyl ester carboxylesterase